MNQSPTEIYYTLASYFFPDEILNYFDVVHVEEVLTGKTFFGNLPEKELHIYLDEKPFSHSKSEGYKPNGFTEGKKLFDFPIRDRKAILHVRRRRWISPSGHNEVLDYGELLGAYGTRFSREFADFLKEHP
jgi:hypothetical protein